MIGAASFIIPTHSCSHRSIINLGVWGCGNCVRNWSPFIVEILEDECKKVEQKYKTVNGNDQSS